MKATLDFFTPHKGFGVCTLEDGSKAFVHGEVFGGDMFGHNLKYVPNFEPDQEVEIEDCNICGLKRRVVRLKTAK